MVIELKWWLGTLVVCCFFGLENTHWVRCLNVLLGKLMSFCCGTLFLMYNVMVCILLAIYNSHVLPVGSVLTKID